MLFTQSRLAFYEDLTDQVLNGDPPKSVPYSRSTESDIGVR